MTPTAPGASKRSRQQGVARSLGKLGFALPGTLALRPARCGKPRCRCKQDPPQLHGPYWIWTRKVAGKTVTRRLSQDQALRYQSWFENWTRLRELVAELQELSLQAASEAEGWQDPAPRQAKRSG